MTTAKWTGNDYHRATRPLAFPDIEVAVDRLL
jgi:hypothetical protein